MRTLVAGANGLVGSRVCAVLARAGRAVVGASRGPRRAAGEWPFESCDFAAGEAVRALCEQVRPDAIINCVSATDVDGCERDRAFAWSANVEAAAHVAAEARRCEAHLVHVSSDYVFDGAAGPYDEEAVADPRSIYGLTKRAGEDAVRTLAGSWAIARTSVVYGWPPGARPNFGSWLLSALDRGEPIRLFEDQIVSPSLALNVAEMLVELADRRLSGVWNVSGGEAVDRVAFGRRCCAVFGFDPGLVVPIRLADAGLAANRPLRSGLRTEKAGRTLHARPLDLDTALRRFRAEREGVA